MHPCRYCGKLLANRKRESEHASGPCPLKPGCPMRKKRTPRSACVTPKAASKSEAERAAPSEELRNEQPNSERLAAQYHAECLSMKSKIARLESRLTALERRDPLDVILDRFFDYLTGQAETYPVSDLSSLFVAMKKTERDETVHAACLRMFPRCHEFVVVRSDGHARMCAGLGPVPDSVLKTLGECLGTSVRRVCVLSCRLSYDMTARVFAKSLCDAPFTRDMLVRIVRTQSHPLDGRVCV